MQTQTLQWQTQDGLKIFGQAWTPENTPKAVFCIVHGMGEHCGRYQNLLDVLIPEGYAVAGFDHRGHGRSEGQRGHTPSYNHLLEDIAVFLAQVDEQLPNLPKILYGHSMGGNVVLNYALRHQPKLKGIIASAPWLRLGFPPPKLQVALGKLVNQFWGNLSQPTKLEVTAISRDTAIVEAYKADTLNHGRITPRFFLSGMEAGEWAIAHAHTLALPTLLYHGTADRLTAPQGSEAFAEYAPKELLTFRLLTDFYHEGHHDTGKEQVFELLLGWLNKLG
jgi:alpha-beta hydrolase superfamily lysophospholipase